MWLWVVIAILATLRVSHLIAIDEGPFGAFQRLRYLIGQRTWIGRGFHCSLCVGFWLAILPALVLARTPVEFGLLWFGIAGGALLIHKGIYK